MRSCRASLGRGLQAQGRRSRGLWARDGGDVEYCRSFEGGVIGVHGESF